MLSRCVRLPGRVGKVSGPDHLLQACLRETRPRVLAALRRYFRDFDLAEDGLQEACARALRAWPDKGIPEDPAAWLVLVGRNAAIDQLRRTRPEQATSFDEQAQMREMVPPDDDHLLGNAMYRDDILRLLFMCCHPELNARDQLALALKVVGGFSVAAIARAFLCAEKAMEQRITRAKKKAGDIAQEFGVPTAQERMRRLSSVMALIYLLFNEGYAATGGDIHINAGLCREAIRLSRLLLNLFPSNPEIMGLLALCMLQHARYEARIDQHGRLIPLMEQDRSRWDQEFIAQGVVMVQKALRKGSAGPYQIQAAIAAVHCSSASAESTDWREILLLYDALVKLQPTPVVELNRAVAVARVYGVRAAIDTLLELSAHLDQYLYYHSTLAGLLLEASELVAARAAYLKALSLNPTEPEKSYMEREIHKIERLTLPTSL